MTGYKRVNFYELCRLCASNQQKDKTHIFQEEGRKIQLQTKIQTCLSLTVCENDFLPKVICSKCLRILEYCYFFRQECVTSETMLSTYFKNFRYTEDFKRSGKVYIKDTTTTTTTTTTTKAYQESYDFIGNSEKSNENLLNIKNDGLKPTTSTTNINLNQKMMIGSKSDIPNHNNSNTTQMGVNTNDIINFQQLVDIESYIESNGIKQKKLKIKKEDDSHQNKLDIIQKKSTKLEQNVLFNTEYNYLNYQTTTSTTTNSATNTNQLESTVNLNVLIQDTSNYHTTPSSVINTNNTTTTPTNATTTTTPTRTGSVGIKLEKTHICATCQKSFKRREHLYQHMKLHTGFRPYTCEGCNKSFVRKEHLLRHMTSHSGQKNFQCTICEKSFSRNDNLLKHKKTHEKQTSYTCDICQKQFVMKHYYLAHRMTHENEGGGSGNNGGNNINVIGGNGGNRLTNNNTLWNVLKT